MSSRASAYAKALVICPNGESIKPREKLVLVMLADAHQDKAKHFTYPSIDTLAEDALCDRRSCQRYLDGLERKGVIRRLRPAHQGRGMQVFYFFTALDVIPEGWQDAALFGGAILRQKGGKRAAEGRQKGGRTRPAPIERAQERELQLELEAKTNPQVPAGGDGGLDCEEPPLDEGQRAHLATLEAGSGKREHYEAWYREENRRKALAAREDTARQAEKDRMRAMLPDAATAAKWVLRECGWVDRGRGNGIGAAVQAQLGLQAQRGSPPWEAGPAMVRAQARYAELGARLRPQYGWVKFVELGIWNAPQSWRVEG